MVLRSRDAKRLFDRLLRAESEDEVTTILQSDGLLDPKNWMLLGGEGFGNNRSIVNNQQSEAGGAFVEKVINSVDSLLTLMCFLAGIDPESDAAPRTMAEAAEKFYGIAEGNLANLNNPALAENIQVVAGGEKLNPCYLFIDTGEGQTPDRFPDTFLSLARTNKARIPFVQGKYNCGGTGVLPFCGSRGYQLIASKRHPDIPADPSHPDEVDPSHALWGFTLVRKLAASESDYNTMAWVYLAPDGEVPRFKADNLPALPDVSPEIVGEESEEEEQEIRGPSGKGKKKSSRPVPHPYAKALEHGTVIKLYNYQWGRRGLATLEVRFELEQYLHTLSLPIRVIETRPDYKANYFATSVTGTAVTITKDKAKGVVEDVWGGEVKVSEVGKLPISIALYKVKKSKDDKSAKNPRKIPRGLRFTINGQVHKDFGPEFFTTRGLKYDYIRDTLSVTVDCTGLDVDVRDQLVMPSRDRCRNVPQLQSILEGVVADLKDRKALVLINDERRRRKVEETLADESAHDVLQHLVSGDPVFATLFKNGKGLRNPFISIPEPTVAFEGKYPPTFFHLGKGKHHISKSFAVDRTCQVNLETDAKNDYFHLPSSADRGQLRIEPECYDRWSLTDGRLGVVLRAPSDASIGDKMDVTITITDPIREAGGLEPWVNRVTLKFQEGGKPVKSGGKSRKKRGGGHLALPNVKEVHKEEWDDPLYEFNDRSGLKVMKTSDGSFDFHINMDNKFLHNELLQHRHDGKDAVKFAFKWGMVLVALGLLQEGKVDEEELPAENGPPVEERVSNLSRGVAAVIVPTVLHLMKVMSEVS
jgi:hypothetical protein